MSSPHDEFRDAPLAYFITFRTYGTWLHGNPRGSVDRFHNRYGTPRLLPNQSQHKYKRKLLKRPPVRLTKSQRKAVERGIKELCKKRNWGLWVVNPRSNHVHVVVTADCKSKQVRSALKAAATRTLRECGLWNCADTPWAARGSRRKLWTQKDLVEAIVYVEYEQGE